MSKNIVVDKLRPNQIENGSIIAIIGKRKSGKSTLIREIMYGKRFIPDGQVMAGTVGAASSAEQYVPAAYVYSGWNRECVLKMYNAQKEENERREALGLPKKYCFLIVDDCNYDNKFIRDPLLKELFMNGRHWGIFFIFTLQYLMDLHPRLRANLDWVFILREPIPENRKKLYTSFVPGVSLKDFNKLMDALTENYRALVVHNTSTNNNIEKNIYWFTANPARKPFRVGSERYWQRHYKLYDKNWRSKKRKRGKEEEEPSQKKRKKRKHPKTAFSIQLN